MTGSLTLFLAGDVMVGRGVDQVLPSSVAPRLHEPYVKDARTYVELAEEEHGPIPVPVDPAYVWGDALDALEEAAPDARIVNLETALTTADEPWPDKGIHYRSHPENVACLTAAGVDCCALANNHVLDWGRRGLSETLRTLAGAGVAAAGAGEDAGAAREPAVLEAGSGRRILVFSFGHASSGIPGAWGAGEGRSGVWLLPDLSEATLGAVAGRIRARRREGDLVVASVHWGGNWGYRIPRDQKRFARGLVDAGVDAIHGHSSHHPRGVEVHRGRPVVYGCGDLLNDYEGIGGREDFRGDLALVYLPTFGGPGEGLTRFRVRPFRIRRFRLERPPEEDVAWLRERLARESQPLGVEVERAGGGELALRWG